MKQPYNLIEQKFASGKGGFFSEKNEQITPGNSVGYRGGNIRFVMGHRFYFTYSGNAFFRQPLS